MTPWQRYIHNVLIAADQLGSALTGGDPDETISSRVGKAAMAGATGACMAEWLIDGLFRVLTGQRGHCRDAMDLTEGEDRVARF